MKLRFGTRGSRLALTQTRKTMELLKSNFPDLEVEEVIIKTLGDKVTDRPLFKVGGQGLFVKEIEEALLTKKIDITVHSLKDVPHTLAEGLILGAISGREDPRDALLTHPHTKLKDLPAGAIIGTSSLRRRSQIAKIRGDLQFSDLRGNLDTRLKKLENGDIQAIVLAAAGLSRLGLTDRVSECFPVDVMIPAAGQGLLGIECRQSDLAAFKPYLDKINDPAGQAAADAERAFLAFLQGGCQVPLGVHARHENGRLRVQGFLASPSGKEFLTAMFVGDVKAAVELGKSVASDLLRQGGEKIILAWRETIQAQK